MTKDKILIFRDYKAMHDYALKLKKYYFDEHFRLLARDPDGIFITTEYGEFIEV